jgi:hypothetical protein
MDFSTKARLARFQAQARKQDPTFYRHGRPAYQAPIRRATKSRHSNKKQTVIDCLIVLAFIVATALILFVGTASQAGLWL